MKKLISFLLVLTLLLGLSACGAADSAEPTAGENQVTDGTGRILDIPAEPEKATIASAYAVAVPFIEALGLGERVLAVNVKSNFWKEADPFLAEAGSVGRGTVDLEAFAAVALSVLIHRSNDPAGHRYAYGFRQIHSDWRARLYHGAVHQLQIRHHRGK